MNINWILYFKYKCTLTIYDLRYTEEHKSYKTCCALFTVVNASSLVPPFSFVAWYAAAEPRPDKSKGRNVALLSILSYQWNCISKY